MVHRRDVFLQQNDYDPKKSLSEKQNDSSAVIQSASCSEISSKQILDAISPSKPDNAKPASRTTFSTPTRKGQRGSLDTTPPKITTRTVKRSGVSREISFTDDTNVQSTQNGKDNQFPKPLRSGLLRASRLQSTSLIEISSIGRKRGRRKTLCNSLDNVSTAIDANLFESCNSGESLGQSSDLLVVEKLTCSLPLEKLSLGIVKSMMVSTSSSCGNLRNHFSDSDLTNDCMSSPASDLVGLSSPQATSKLLCLYCDKKFTSQKILCKHTERVHATDGRRLSSRNSITSLSWPSIIAFPGCWICGNSGQKSANASSAAGVVDDLKALFQHLIEVHSDKYYACTFCNIRFSNAETKEEHFKQKHAEGTSNNKDVISTPSMLENRNGGAKAPPENISKPLQINVDPVDRTSPSEDNEIDNFAGKIFSAKTRRQIRQQALQTRTTLVTRSCQNVLRNNEDTILTRLGVAQNRLPRGRKGTRNRRLVNAEIVKPEQISNPIAKSRNKAGRAIVSGMKDVSEVSQSKSSSGNRPEPVSCTFDDDFYETVSVNVRQNLSCHLDGKLEGGPTSPSPLSPVPTVPAIRSTVVRSPLNADSEIHEATALAAVTAFPTLLTAEQYGSDWIAERKIKRPITKHSWKWKWDCVKKYKYVNEGGKIVKKVKQPMSGLRDLSKLDMWTQLTMRTKHEIARKQEIEVTGISDILEVGEVAREEKRKQIAQLTTILDSRVFPQIVLEQKEQSLVKLEPHDSETVDSEAHNTLENSSLITTEGIPEILQLSRRGCHETLRRKENLVLSGEWARPRCYICFSCGGRFDKLKTLEEHKVSRHPYIYSTHYEIVGRELLGDDLYKHLFIPVKALRRHLEYRQRIKDLKTESDAAGSSSGNGVNGEEESMDSVNSLTASSASANGAVTTTTISTISSLEEHLIAADAATVHMARRCTKCKRMCNGKLELYRHMLNCSGDYAWRIAQKRKYRYFGVKSRRNARQNLQRMRQVAKKIVKKELSENAENGENSAKCNAVRTRPSDADTIRRMLENLPPKRACRQIIPNITKPRSRKFAKNLGLKNLVNTTSNKKMKGKTVTVASTTLTAISSNMRRKQRLIARQITRRSGRMALRLRELKQNSNNIGKKKSQPKEQKQQSESTAIVMSNLEKSPNEKKNQATEKKSKRGEVASNNTIDTPDGPNEVNKTPKKKQSPRKSQEKSPKADEVPLQLTEHTSNKNEENRMFTENSSEIASIESSNPTEPLNLVVPLQQSRSPFLQVSPANKRQRGKKLTDCIAKLQEKLGKPFFEGSENLETVLSARQQSPPQENSASSSCLTSSMVCNTIPAESTIKTPKRKTVTRKIIQKLSSDTIVSSKAAQPTLDVKVECEEDFSKSKLTSKDQDASVTSDMYDSLVESEKCDAPSRVVIALKDSTLNELNDSAVSSMSTDSILTNNVTPEKLSEQIISKGLIAAQLDSAFRKSSRKNEKCILLPTGNTMFDCDSERALNLSIGLQDNDPKEQSFLPFTTDRALRKGRNGRTPPNLNKVDALPIVEEALNLTMRKRRQSVTPAKTNLQNEQSSTNSIAIGDCYPNLTAPVIDNELVTPKIVESMNLFADGCKSGFDISLSSISSKKERKKPKSRKFPNTDTKGDLSNLSPAEICSAEPAVLISTPKCPNVDKQTNKPGKKIKTLPVTPLFENPKIAKISEDTVTSTPTGGQNELTKAHVRLQAATLNATPTQENGQGSEETQSNFNNESVISLSNVSNIKKGRGRRRKEDTQSTEMEKESDSKNTIDHTVSEKITMNLTAEEKVTAKKLKKGRNSKKNVETGASNMAESMHVLQNVDTVAQTNIEEALKSPAPGSKFENVKSKDSRAKEINSPIHETLDAVPKPRGKGRPRKKKQQQFSPEVNKPTDLQPHVSSSQVPVAPVLQPPIETQSPGKNEIEFIDRDANERNTLSEKYNQSIEGEKAIHSNSDNVENNQKSVMFTSQAEKQEPVKVQDEATELVANPLDKQERKLETNALELPAHEKPSTSKSSTEGNCKNSVFDTLRAVQENVFFNRNDNAGLTRKYSRKGSLATKKAVTEPLVVPSTGSNKLNIDNLDKITLNDGKYIVSALIEKTNPENLISKSIDHVTYKAPEPSKALLYKRRSNRNKPNTKMIRDNSSICKELDDIVASFLQDGPVNTTVPKYFDQLDGPTRLINIESLLQRDHANDPTSQMKNNDALVVNLENNEILDNTNVPNEQIPANSLGTKQSNVFEKKVVCRELSIALTKMSDSEIQAKTEKVSKTDESEPTNKILVNTETLESRTPSKTRGSRLSIKLEKAALTDKFDDFENIQLDMAIIKSNESSKVCRKRKNTASTNVDEVIHMSAAVVETPCLENRIEPAIQDALTEAQKSGISEIHVEAQSKIFRPESTSGAPTLVPNETNMPDNSKPPSDSPAPKQSTTRRRRKNELAAIVADQLLESFKEVDKSRIDELKKLENLAYEKSDDLYITGIRLTPLTKRKIVLEPKEDSNPPRDKPKAKTKQKKNATGNCDQEKEPNSDRAIADKEKPAAKTISNDKDKTKTVRENLFRNFVENKETPKLNVDPISMPKLGARNFSLTFGTFRSYTTPEFTFGSQKESALKYNFIPGSAETSCSVDSQGNRMQEDGSSKAPTEASNNKSSLHRKVKKKMSRYKKEKKVENENINELRSGLESFTFGKNTFHEFGKGLFESIGFSGLFSSNKEKNKQNVIGSSSGRYSKDIAATRHGKKEDESRKPFLRPSILSAVLSQENVIKKTSRDPRLNKSKLKLLNDESNLQPPDIADTFLKPKTRRGSKTKKSIKSIPPIKITQSINNDEDDDDHCLAAIAQSVNNRIMSEEEEFSQTDEFDVPLPAEVTASQLLLQTGNATFLPDDQRTSDVPNDDENTNTELIDMDLEDDVSIYTSFSQDVSSLTGKSRFGQRRRRRRSILMARKPKKTLPEPNLLDTSFDCTICNKTFAKATALAKHQQTFTHVQKLSEYEYLNKLNEPKTSELESKESKPNQKTGVGTTPLNEPTVLVPSKQMLADDVNEAEHESEQHASIVVEKPKEDANDKVPPTITDIPPASINLRPPDTLTSKIASAAPDEVETISSPEQVDAAYDRYQNSSSRIALSQEERLFYECCNMLKGSETPMIERAYPIVPNAYATYDVPNKPVTPKSSERFSYLGSDVTGNFQHSTAYTVKSPLSQSRTSPRYAYPKIDANQFSDISSDSNPAFARTQLPHIALQPGPESVPIREMTTVSSKVPYYDQTTIPSRIQNLSTDQLNHGPNHHPDASPYYTAADDGARHLPLELSLAARVLTARTYIGEERGKVGNISGGVTGYSNMIMDAERSGVPTGCDQPLTSPLHSNSSQGSNNTNITSCRMRTKAAMKGYDNFKVSIPTTGLDMQQALERSPHAGCKLTALAEIALGSEAPITPPRYQPPASPAATRQDETYEKHSSQQQKSNINEKFARKYQELIMNNIKPTTSKNVKKKEICDNSGSKLVTGHKTKKCRSSNKPTILNEYSPSKENVKSAIICEKPPKDIYEFEESQEALDKDVDRGSPSKGRSSIVIPERPFKNIGSEEQNTIKFHKPNDTIIQNEESQMSTTSYSDRDDFNYGSMSEGRGEETDKEEENEEAKSSDSDSCASAQTAKTHKCLIVGRIFGNVNKSRHAESSEKPQSAPEPKKKIPSEELNQMFDRLRKDGSRVSEGQRESHENPDQSQHTVGKRELRTVPTKSSKSTKVAAKTKKAPTSKPSVKPTSSAGTSKRESERLSKAIEPELPREYAKLQAELGMSAEEIAELIGEGKRKSQRKCAINRPRTVIDAWSSDEYEDFLATKDVIALIEEKEKKSKKKKLVTKNNSEKSMSASDPKESIKDNEAVTLVAQSKKREITEEKSSLKCTETTKKTIPERVVADKKEKKPQRVADRLLQRFNKSRSSRKPKDTTQKLEQPTKCTNSKSVEEKILPLENRTAVTTNDMLPEESTNTQKKQPTLSVKPRLKPRRHSDDSESDFENELRRRKSTSSKRTTSKISKRRKTIAFKEEHNAISSDSKYAPKPKQSAIQKAVEESPPALSTKSPDNSPSTVRPLARRKRVASEMLYYWSSSSSDEEFGRIETNDEDVAQKDEYLPKHGWIVGDSHKKLVTLLATAKGKKTTDLKEPGSKKKS